MNGLKLTEAQLSAVREAYSLLGEHFDSSLVVVALESNTEDGNSTDAAAVQYTGGFFNALGLCNYAWEYLKSQAPFTLDT